MDAQYVEKGMSHTAEEIDKAVDQSVANANEIHGLKEYAFQIIQNDLNNLKQNKADTETVEELKQEINELNQDAENKYTKSEVDGKLDNKVEKTEGKGLSTNDFTDEDKANVEKNTADIEKIKVEIQNNDYIEIKKFGAVGDGITDCSTAFSNAINYANENNVDIHIPHGEYLISQDLPDIYGNIFIVGDSYQRLDGITSVIHDRRTSDNALFNFKQKTAGTKQGGGIISLSMTGCGTTKNCIEVSSHNFGWDGNFHYVSIADYTHAAIKTDANDIWWSNCLIHNCGNNEDEVYAIEMVASSNAQRYSDIHIEHCRFAIHVGEYAFLNSFENCKVEASDVYIGNSKKPVTYINSNSAVDFPPVKFDNCYFIGLDFQHYVDMQETPNYYDAAFFMKSTTSQPVVISSCSFFGGQGTGKKNYNSQYKYLSVSNGIVSSCYFQRPAFLTPGIIMYNGVFSSNRVHFANNLSTKHDVALATTNYGISFPDRYIETPSISIDGFFCDGFYPCNRNIDCDSNARTNTNWYYRGRPVQLSDTNYITYVLRNLNSNKNMLGYVEVEIQSVNTALINGKIAVYMNHTNTGYDVIRISNISATSEKERKVIVFLKDGDLYIQVKADINGYLINARGLELYENFGYMDSTITEPISDYDFRSEIDIPSELQEFTAERKTKLESIKNNANLIRYDNSVKTKTDGLTYTYNNDGTITIQGVLNWDADIELFKVDQSGTYTVFIELVSGTIPNSVKVRVDSEDKTLLNSNETSAQKQFTGTIGQIKLWSAQNTTVDFTIKLAVGKGIVDYTNDYVAYTGDTGIINQDVAQLKNEVLSLLARVSALEESS